MEKFYFDDLFGSTPTNTFEKIDKMFEEMFKPAIDDMKSGSHKVIVIDSLPELHRLLEQDAIKTHKQKQACEEGKVGKCKSTPICLEIQSVLANRDKKAFTVIWADGTHTMIHLQPGDTWDNEKALAMCFVKHLFGDKSDFNDIFTEELPSKLKEISKKEEPVKADEPKDASAGIKKLEDVCAKAGIDLKKAGDAAGKAESTLTGLLEKFLSSSTPVYDVYTKKNGTTVQIMAAAEKDMIGKYLKMYIQKNYPALIGTPWRIWNAGKKDLEMYIDFGASEYFVIPGMTCEEWNKNN